MTTQQDSVDVERYGNFRVLPATPTEDQRQAARASSLYSHGDMRLMWVNEGDLDALVFAPTAALSLPITQRDEQGECICTRCGIRHGGRSSAGDF